MWRIAFRKLGNFASKGLVLRLIRRVDMTPDATALNVRARTPKMHAATLNTGRCRMTQLPARSRREGLAAVESGWYFKNRSRSWASDSASG